MGVQRYSPACVKDSTGDWVEYDDYLHLRNTLNETRERLTEAEGLANQYSAEIDRLKNELEKVEAERDAWAAHANGAPV